MKKLTWCVAVVAAMFGTVARAQDLSGNWQGTLKAGKDLRIIFNLYKGDKDGWSAKMYSIDQTSQAVPVNSVTRTGSDIKMTIDMIGGGFAGKLSDDGKTITGTWTQGTQPFPLTLTHATPDTAWDIPTPPPTEKPMAVAPDPSFEVATIKPNPSGGNRLLGIRPNGRHLVVTNGSLQDLITFAFSLQLKQVVGAPEWTASDRYDIDAVPDQPGAPSLEQMRSMLRKLLMERFSMTIHHEKREMSAYLLTVGKAGQKLTVSQIQGNIPGFGASPGPGGLTLHLINGTMNDFTSFLQMLILDKPVVDLTGITGRYDANVTFSPDQTQFNGNPPKLPPTDAPDAPDLFTATQRQLGLNLTAEKTQVDVMVIDHVEKPSAN